jgi:PPOX class probable F420-dependent enzyme
MTELDEALLTGPATGVLTTLMPDGSPQSSPVWFLYEAGAVLVSTMDDRVKARNARKDPRVTFTVFDRKKPLHYIEFRGSVIVEDDPTAALRDRIAQKHGFADGAAFDPPGARRVTLRLTPDRVVQQ